ncbi:hypothetical protein [Bremerella volcania]|uniref:hypothetical protein n=1 Tax=Bremerella volcania TaxID=2527984 RepID=UPI0011A8A0EF|nr:hypothetical protein [Bremerella volcania]
MSDVSQPAGPMQFSEAAIFGRVVESSGELSVEIAEHILSLAISADDQRRVKVLLEKNAGGLLTEAEHEELENLNHVADLLSLWHSRARRALRSK